MSLPSPPSAIRPADTRAPTPPPLAAGSDSRWHLQLLGRVRLHNSEQDIERFPSRAVAALLARLALSPQRAHGREELVELLWPGVSLEVGRNRLRQALSTLRSLLEPARQGGVLIADRSTVRLVSSALACDAHQFTQLCQRQPQAAAALYGGELMPGFYDEWIQDERQRLTALWEALGETLPSATIPAHEEELAEETAVANDSVHPHRASVHNRPTALPASLPPSLPFYLTRLFGTEQTASALYEAVLLHRLVTLIGAGGSGKTRLAVAVAQTLTGRFERVHFVPLVSCETAAQAHGAVLRALRLPATMHSVDGADSDPVQLALALADTPVLLVLDNFEQLLPQAQAWVAQLLAAVPTLHLLVTSRRALGLDGEHEVAAQPLPLPEMQSSLAQAAACPAVKLFIDRARGPRPDFHLTAGNLRAIVDLVRLLHGMPLAIELAASRGRSFAPAELLRLLAGDGQPDTTPLAATGAVAPTGHAAGLGLGRPRLQHPQTAQLALLTRAGPRAGNDPRHASMAEVIAWSWRLLDTDAQALLVVLTVFVADASTPAIAAAAGMPLARAAALLDSLVAQSMLRLVQPGDGGARFVLLEPVREYAVQQAAAGARQAATAALRRWAIRWASSLASEGLPARVTPELPIVYSLLGDDADDVSNSAATADALDAARDKLAFALALRAYWEVDAMPGVLQTALEVALQRLPQQDLALRADAHELLAYLRFEAGFVAQAQEHADAAVAAARASSDGARCARALVRRAWVFLAAGHGAGTSRQGLAAVAQELDEALALAQACGDTETQARAWYQQAVFVNQTTSDTARTEALIAQSEKLWLALGDRRKAMARLRNRAQCWVRMGRVEEARACFEDCEVAAREEGDWLGQIDSQLSLATLLERRRQWAAALAVNRRCVALCWQRWQRHSLGYALWNPARLLARLRQPEPAMQLLGFAVTYWSTQFGRLSATDERYVRRVKALVVAQLGAARADVLWREGTQMNVATAVALALQVS